ncbi:SdhA Succinate dehydrogenase/fumarate reductase, flavoprotein subunit [uncultured Caudovirales phage]|uniref:SdhA Succinate dehydrogenase/fumarate reductase, flavoprotein subunit n=1 Tax=uncultured Caudovirales phage TaxID=2100421 RepID=A0A6J5NY33_9CAUD|nr:SdhA Succinate dehydrogenase/fumarate reductase, flavoprotein subunit [uncultured Caudovirales phage]CAB4165777.1 SdhA Succinate dehydrogenase/fumarate reductase, flavoprotein subunit [uncultured Caudovirales phage]CAB4186993.1 SdhA Succinate dehydrogenase/fumarate reductase, flavoprotein subunit [uncultured Caudovirales phage]CAB4221250.1 SdhA Succinate dehydrogenase/fumarate reductase, flavoprotein subunit [uncultured Caudovirales phage]
MNNSIDVLVIGSGAAGMLAAITAAQNGQSTVLLTKGQAGRCGATATIVGGCSVDGNTCVELLGLKANSNDSAELFFNDMMAGGKYINNPKLVESIVTEIGPIIQWLRINGLNIGNPTPSAGHAYSRGVVTPGMEILQTLKKFLISFGVKVREEFFATELLLNDGIVSGVAGIDMRSGKITAIQANSIILATGGGMRIYPHQTAPEELTGDGHAMAIRAGAKLIDMEMIQFLPCTLITPRMWSGIQFPWILGPQSGIRAWLLNRYGERFMAKWDPINMEMATRDIISIACTKEILENRGGPNGGVFMSWAHLPSNIIDFAADWYFNQTSELRAGGGQISGNWQWEGFDFSQLVADIKNGNAIEVSSASHFFMGGLLIDEFCATSIPGLFACGEVAGGAHGANRLGGNATSQILVQGKIAGNTASKYAKSNSNVGITATAWKDSSQKIKMPIVKESGISPFEIKQELQNIANINVSMLRSGPELKSALSSIQKLRSDILPFVYTKSKDRIYNKEWTEAIECHNMTDTLEAIILSASKRDESRGAHYREDFPQQNELAVNGITKQLNGIMCYESISCPTKYPK